LSSVDPHFSELLKSALESSRFKFFGYFDWPLLDPKVWKHHTDHYQLWLDQGNTAEMHYLNRGIEKRKNPKLYFEKLESVLMIGQPYSTIPLGFSDLSKGPRYARYLREKDYHKDLSDQLNDLLKDVKLKIPQLEFKIFVDTSPVLERSLAAACGLGWIGKNTLLIHPRYGSYFFLGGAFLSLKTERAPNFIRNLCGNCSACIEGCPTSALDTNGILKSTRCISYQTLENRKAIDLTSQELGPWIAGCDICQEVCPFNLRRTKEENRSGSNEDLRDSAKSFYQQEWSELESLDTETYRKATYELALNRIKPDQFKRNIRAIKPH
jgi:epoxyqueuosine reductase